MEASTPTQIDRERIKELTEREEKVLDERTGGSGAMYRRANKTLAAAWTSASAATNPHPRLATHVRSCHGMTRSSHRDD